MPKFAYTALEADGTTIRGVARASHASAVQETLQEREARPLSIVRKKGLLHLELTPKKIKQAELMQFSRQLGAFTRAGIPIIDAIDILRVDGGDKVLRDVLADVSEALRRGERLSSAVEAHSSRFPRFYVDMLRAAELTGSLDSVLNQLADYLERDLEAKRKIRSALAYPAVIAMMSVVTVAILTTFVLPRFKSFFESLNAELPLPTRMLLSFTDFMSRWWMVVTGALAAIALFLAIFLRTARGRSALDRILLRVPVIGPVVRYSVVERFCRMLASMARAGVPLPQAMEATAQSASNEVFRRGLRTAREEMIQGEGLAGPIARTNLFPVAATQMIRVGENTGTLDEQLEITGHFFEQELQYRIKRLTTLFEPAVIIAMGAVVGFVAIALVSAMYGIFSQSGKF